MIKCNENRTKMLPISSAKNFSLISNLENYLKDMKKYDYKNILKDITVENIGLYYEDY